MDVTSLVLTSESVTVSKHMVMIWKKALIAIVAASVPALTLAATVYETHGEFLTRAFGDTPPAPGVVWLSGERKIQVRQLLGHAYPALRLRYWCDAGRSAWVLEEIGKDLPITIGVIIDKDHIQSLRVLTYRKTGVVKSLPQRFQINSMA